MNAPGTAKPRRRALIVKLGSIGDVIMTNPGAALLAEQGYAVDWVVSEAVAPVVQLYPWIHGLAVNESRLLRGLHGGRVQEMAALWRTLRRRVAVEGGYQMVATLYYDARYRLVGLPVRAERKVSLSRTDRRFLLLPGRHHTDEYARILTGAPDEVTPTQLAPVPVSSLPPSPRALGDRPRVVLVPAGARNLLRDDALRRWPVELYVELAEALLGRGYEVVLAGGPEDRWASAHFAALAARTRPDQFGDEIGNCNLVDTLALMDSAAVTVTHDTGPLHMAGLTRTAVVGIFGPTDPRGRLPQRAGTVALWGGEGFACRPCYDGRAYAPCSRNRCMEQVTPAMVLVQVETLLRAKFEGRLDLPQVLAPAHTAVSLVSLEGA